MCLKALTKIWNESSEDSRSLALDYIRDLLNKETDVKYLNPTLCFNKILEVGVFIEVGIRVFS